MKVLVTGGTNGMGKGVAKVLAGMDNRVHEVIILCRSKELGMATAAEFERTVKNKKTSIVICDLTRLHDVRSAIEEIQTNHPFLDGIFINAGLGYAAQRVETIDGMDPHFQVNYLSQFMLVLNLLPLLENSKTGGRVIFNVTQSGRLFWDDLQMKAKWDFEDAIHQAMTAKRMFYVKLHDLVRRSKTSKLSFIGFEIPKTVWSNQLTIIPLSMRIMATIAKLLGQFISIEECGRIMAPLFTETQDESLKKSGQFITWKKNQFTGIKEDPIVFDQAMQDRLWNISLELCKDEKTIEIARKLEA